MKKLTIALLMLLASAGADANPIQYFTASQARRTVNYLKHQDELVIYCGYEYELETYVIVSDIWAERASDSRYYEIWLYGYDAYTGEEIYMPIDLSCIWLFDRRHTNVYSAARYLRFRCDAPYIDIVWSMPVYHSFVRMPHPPMHARTYHYDVHRHGWKPVPDMHLHDYYMRPPTAPLPVVTNSYIPEKEKPQVNINSSSPNRVKPTTSRSASTGTRSSSAAIPAPNSTHQPTAGGNTQPQQNNSRSSSTRSNSSTTPDRNATNNSQRNSTSTNSRNSNGTNTQTTTPSHKSNTQPAGNSTTTRSSSSTSRSSNSQNSSSSRSSSSNSRSSSSNGGRR